MPELPEVETIVRGLAPQLRGRRIEAVWWSGQPLHLRRPVNLKGLRALAVGRDITAVRRRRQVRHLRAEPQGTETTAPVCSFISA